jgi:hypothetical protein
MIMTYERPYLPICSPYTDIHPVKPQYTPLRNPLNRAYGVYISITSPNNCLKEASPLPKEAVHVDDDDLNRIIILNAC